MKLKAKLEQLSLVENLFRKSMEKGRIGPSPPKDIQKLSGDASTRSYYRISTNKCKHSYIACLDFSSPLSSSSFIKMQKIFLENGVRVPKVYDEQPNDGYYLIEDLGDETLLRRLAIVKSQGQELELYKESIDLMLKIHHISLKKYREFEFTRMALDPKRLWDEIEFTCHHFIRKLMNGPLNTREEKTIKNGFQEICDEFSKEKMIVTHRDFHSRNIMIKENSLVAIDFQDTRMGIPQYDLVSLLEDCYYQIDDANRSLLKQHYWENFPQLNEWQNEERFHYLYDLMAIQRVFKAIGSFSSIFSLRGETRYLKYIGFGFEKIRCILMKDTHLKFSELRKTLAKVYYEN